MTISIFKIKIVIFLANIEPSYYFQVVMLEIAERNSVAALAVKQINRQAGEVLLNDWRQGHGCLPIKKECLCGLCFLCGSIIKDHAVAFVYMDDTSEMCHLSWIAANPQNTPEETHKSLCLIIKDINMDMKIRKKSAIMVFATTSGFFDLFKRCGFNEDFMPYPAKQMIMEVK